jgi:hypothetical protein
MSRPLVPGLLAEGKTDEIFLGTVIFRQLRQMTERAHCHAVDVAMTEIGGCRTTGELDAVTTAALELAGDCHVLCVHSDHNERGRVARVKTALAGHGCAVPVISLVPVRETEAWLLADPQAWKGVRGSDVNVLPKSTAELEKLPDPKKVLDAVLPVRRRRTRDDYFDYLGRHIDLTTLARLPAYSAWSGEVEKALEGLGYL